MTWENRIFEDDPKAFEPIDDPGESAENEPDEDDSEEDTGESLEECEDGDCEDC